MKFHLENGVELHRANPSTYQIPTRQQKKMVEVGDLVKVAIAYGTREKPKTVNGLCGERLWVEVTEVNWPKFTGRLDSIPMGMHDIQAPIFFRQENILSTWGDK